MNNEPFIKVYDDLIPAYLQDHLELITLGIKSNSEEFIDPSVNFKCKYEITAKETNQPPLSFVHLLKSQLFKSLRDLGDHINITKYYAGKSVYHSATSNRVRTLCTSH